jgi:hypothetical protein
MNPLLKTFYDRLKAAGKMPKVVIVAVMRKMITTLNAMVATMSSGPTVSPVGTVWRPRGSRCADRSCRVKAVAERSVGARSASLDATRSISDPRDKMTVAHSITWSPVAIGGINAI